MFHRVCRFIFNKGIWQDTGECQTLYRAANKHTLSKTVYGAVLPLSAKRRSFSLSTSSDKTHSLC